MSIGRPSSPTKSEPHSDPKRCPVPKNAMKWVQLKVRFLVLCAPLKNSIRFVSFRFALLVCPAKREKRKEKEKAMPTEYQSREVRMGWKEKREREERNTNLYFFSLDT